MKQFIRNYFLEIFRKMCTIFLKIFWAPIELSLPPLATLLTVTQPQTPLFLKVAHHLWRSWSKLVQIWTSKLLIYCEFFFEFAFMSILGKLRVCNKIKSNLRHWNFHLLSLEFIIMINWWIPDQFNKCQTPCFLKQQKKILNSKNLF